MNPVIFSDSSGIILICLNDILRAILHRVMHVIQNIRPHYVLYVWFAFGPETDIFDIYIFYMQSLPDIFMM